VKANIYVKAKKQLKKNKSKKENISSSLDSKSATTIAR
jgi:hypothetical protein